jgi:energy-coupling factor transporter ATP-binding protein EcfA2
VKKSAAKKRRTWLASVEVGGVPGLGGDVKVELSPRCTVLVGRNGAGKSLLVEAIEGGLEGALRITNGAPPRRFHGEISSGQTPSLSYEFHRRPRPSRRAADRGGDEEGARDWFDERCVRHDRGKDRELWRLEKGVLRLEDNPAPWHSAEGLLVAWPKDLPRPVEEAVETLSAGFGHRTVAAGVPRPPGPRQPLITPPPRVRVEAATRLQLVQVRLLWDADTLPIVRDQGRRLGLLEEIQVDRHKRPSPRPSDDPQTAFIEVLVDGVNLGLLSDGTQRALELLVVMAADKPLLLLEEPETETHPGLLARLLNQIESFAVDHQVIISTHSMQVVSWARPEEIRLVERREGRTTVRALGPGEHAQLRSYLAHDGTLGEFVFGGALED